MCLIEAAVSIALAERLLAWDDRCKRMEREGRREKERGA